jgi:hypothetical protein
MNASRGLGKHVTAISSTQYRPRSCSRIAGRSVRAELQTLMEGHPALKNRDAFERRRMAQQHFIGRISVHESDPGHSNYANLIRAGYDVSVFLDDERQECWVTADSNQGWIQCVESNRT